jgi:small subunit ribosomal protein S20
MNFQSQVAFSKLKCYNSYPYKYTEMLFFKFRRLSRLANVKSAIKSIRQDVRKTARNRPVRSSLKTYVKNAVTRIATGEEATSQEAVRIAISKLDKAAQKGIIHKNQAARRKSRLARKLNKQFAATAQE